MNISEAQRVRGSLDNRWHPENSHQGYGAEAIETIPGYAFGTGINRVGLSVFEFNEEAISAYERLGFRGGGTPPAGASNAKTRSTTLSS